MSLSIDVTVTRSTIGNTNRAVFAYFLKSVTPSSDKPSRQILCMPKCCKGSSCSGSLSVPSYTADPVSLFQESRHSVAPAGFSRLQNYAHLLILSVWIRRGSNHLYSSHSVSGGGEGPSATSGGTKSMKHGAQQNCVTHVTIPYKAFVLGHLLCLGMMNASKASSAKLLALLENTTMWYSYQD